MIDFEFRLIGDRQGGQHAITTWLFRQFNGQVYWKNSAQYKHDLLEMSGYPNMKKFSKWSEKTIDKYTAIAANYEDKTMEIIRTYPYEKQTKERYDIIVLRDPYNLFASKIYNWSKNSPMRLKQLSKKIGLWKQKAREVVDNQCDAFINFTKWFHDEEYRKEILSWFGEDTFTFTDEGKESMPIRFGKSSFDTMDYDGRASQMDILGRYKCMIKDELMQSVINDKEIKELSDQIFGLFIF